MGPPITSQLEMGNFETASASSKPLFAIAVAPFDLTCSPGNSFRWAQQVVIDSASIGDVMVGKWHVWIFVPVLLRFPVNVADTPPTTLFDIYEEMGWRHASPFGMSSTIRSSTSSVGRIITTHARGGQRRYSIYSHLQACGRAYQLPHMSAAWPIVSDTGREPTPAQKTVAPCGHPFWLSKVQQGDFTPSKLCRKYVHLKCGCGFVILSLVMHFQTHLANGLCLHTSMQIYKWLGIVFPHWEF